MLKSSRIFVQRSWPATGALLALSLLSCDSGSEAAENSADTETCTVSTNDDGSQVLECPGQEPVTFAESPTCSIEQGEGSITLSCPGQDPVSFETGSTSCEVDQESDSAIAISCAGQDPVTIPAGSGSCEIERDQDGSVTVACPGQDPVTVPADSGSCEVEQDQDGSVTVACPGQDPITVPANSGSCQVEQELDGSVTVACPGQDPVTVPPDSGTCEIEQEQDGSVTVACPGQDPITVPADSGNCTVEEESSGAATISCPGQADVTVDSCTVVTTPSENPELQHYATRRLQCSDGTSASVPGQRLATSIAVGGQKTCALLISGSVRCWGQGQSGALGYGNTNNIGDDELPRTAGDVDLGEAAIQIAVGAAATCALLESGSVRCWGSGSNGSLGLASTENIGDDELPSSVGYVNVGARVKQLAVGGQHVCALIDTGAIRCWGGNTYGQLGYGIPDEVGDDETPASMGDVDVGGEVAQVVAAGQHTCALLASGSVRCWGNGASGRTGYGTTDIIGDDEVPAAAGDVDVGGSVVQLAAGTSHTCALLASGAVRCWGPGSNGQLGYGNTDTIGDDEAPAAAGDVEIGGLAVQVVAGLSFSCALLESGAVRCWGSDGQGRLGYNPGSSIGDDEAPSSVAALQLGGPIARLAPGYGSHMCALLDSGSLRCWGYNFFGQLGYGNKSNIGDDETPASAGDVPYL